MNNLEVALVKRLCPVCLKEQDAEIIMNSKLTSKDADSVKEMHGKVVGYGDLCEDCKSPIGEGVYFIGVDDYLDSSNPSRSGHIVGITKEAAERLGNEQIVKAQWCFCEVDHMKQIGLINE